MIQPEYLEYIAPYNFWYRDVDAGIKRSAYVERAVRTFGVPGVAVCITGVRRAGKTYICRQVLRELIERGVRREETLYVNLEEPGIEPYLGVDFLQDLYETYRHRINPDGRAFMVLDEVQKVRGWERWVRAMMDRDENVRFIITGSSSGLMNEELSTLMTGRYVGLRVYPLSFAEYLSFRGVGEAYIREGDMERHLVAYLETGGFPAAVLTQDRELRMAYLKDLFDSVVTRDIISRYGLRRVHELRSAVVLLLQSVSSPVSVPKMSNTLTSMGIRMSTRTLNQYLHYLREAMLFHYVPIFSTKVKDHMQYPKKAYCVDTGLVNAVSFKLSDNWGKLAENAVAVELMRRYGPESVFYWKGEGGREVDFAVVRGGMAEVLIQVCWEMEDARTRRREINALVSAMKDLGLREGFILTRGAVEDVQVGGKIICVRPIWRWLLGRDGV